MIRGILWSMGAPARAVLVGLLLLYRGTAGRLAAGRCRFHPTCSAYALEAVRTHGALKGSGLAVWRILRCSPLTAGGLDPVPERRTWRRPVDPAVVR
ncbi:MAG: membrane protein insertion efficiency factor YidD [Pseudonocardiaceae bacterium]